MIDLDNLEAAPQPTQVEPSDKIFAELGNNTYDYKDVLSELIDNAIAARSPDAGLEVRIQISVDAENTPREFVIKDNARGIPQDRLGLAITPAGIQGENSLNEHGLGMKQAVSALGTLKYLATKTNDEAKARVVREFRFGELETFCGDFDTETGTEISVTDLRRIVVTHAGTITRTIVPYLGARYRRFLKPDNKLLDLRLALVSADDGQEQYTWVVEKVKPVYFHPQTRENRPVILSYPIDGEGWQAGLTFGYAPKDEAEYEELGCEPPNKFHRNISPTCNEHVQKK